MDFYDRGTQRPQQLKFLLSSAQQLKVFKTSLQVLMKVGGSNLFIVADENQVSLSACNSSRSCFTSSDLQRYVAGLAVRFPVRSHPHTPTLSSRSSYLLLLSFARSFFSTYEFSCRLPKLRASIPFKNVQAILRTSRMRVLTFSLMPELNFLIATLECEHGLMKEYRVAFSEDQAIFRPSAASAQESAVTFDTNNASSFSKVLSTMHVNSAADLVAIAYDSSNDSIKLFTDCYSAQARPDAEVQKDALHTSLEMNNSIGHFGSIRNTLGMSTKVSFNLKDFLVLVHTAEGFSCDLSLRFSVPGRPIVASCSPGRDCRLEMILVTLNLTGALPSNVMSGGTGGAVHAASVASQQSLGSGAIGSVGLVGRIGIPNGGNNGNYANGHSQNPFDMLNLGTHPNGGEADLDETEAEFGALGDDADVIASTPPQSPARRDEQPHTPGVIM